jgi:hypothetical protein
VRDARRVIPRTTTLGGTLPKLSEDDDRSQHLEAASHPEDLLIITRRLTLPVAAGIAKLLHSGCSISARG